MAIKVTVDGVTVRTRANVQIVRKYLEQSP